MATITYESVLRDAQQLMPDEQRRLLEALTTFVFNSKAMDTRDAEAPTPKRSLLGIAADLGPGPSAEEIDEARREAWANFPRDDI